MYLESFKKINENCDAIMKSNKISLQCSCHSTDGIRGNKKGSSNLQKFWSGSALQSRDEGMEFMQIHHRITIRLLIIFSCADLGNF